MKKYTLSATPRTIVGRKVKNLRKLGVIPATIYGKKITSTSVSINQKEFEQLYKEAGETGLVELTTDRQKHPVLIDHVQLDPVMGTIIHVAFHEVDLKEKVTAKVPIELVGEAPAATQKLGVVLSILDEIEVEALPAELPEHIIVHIDNLANVNDEIKVSDLDAPKDVTIQTDPGLTIVKIGALVTKEAERQAEEEEKAAASAKTTETPEETETEEKKEIAAPEEKIETPAK